MSELKKVFDAARALNGHTVKQAGEAMGDDGYSTTTLERFFRDDLPYPDRVEKAVRKYIYDAGLIKSVCDLGLSPDGTDKKIANCKS